jgi:N-acetylmuramoyl-L-alanine amidase
METLKNSACAIVKVRSACAQSPLRQRWVLPALLLCGVLASSCGGPPSSQPMPELYTEFRESVEDVDTSVLEGVKIVLDPGHGGRYAGAVGPAGLREADVNLGVALHLWGLLSDAGADVVLTRSSDRAVAKSDEASLRDDLLARSGMANEAGADLFISIHHNSSLSRDPGLNRIETYHKLFDSGPSADAARFLHDHLSFNIGETRGGVFPGNYLVLRSCEGAAVLGEPSFISNPGIESKLMEADVQRMEASAYFLGIVDYFSKGVPRLRRIAPADGKPNGPTPLIELSAEPGGDTGIAAADVEMLLDGKPVPAEYDPSKGLVRYTPAEPIAGGSHTLEARARNTAGNWSPTVAFTLDIKTEPAHLVLNPQRVEGAADGTPRAIEALVYDANMNPVADGTPVFFQCDRPVFPETTYVRSGSALCYVVAGPTGSFELRAFCGGASMGLAVDPAAADGETWWVFLHDASDAAPVGGASVSVDGRQMAVSNRDGLVSFSAPAGEDGTWRIAADGYEWAAGGAPRLVESTIDSVPDVPVRVLNLRRAAAGLLAGHTLVLDPEGGGDDRAGQGPSGTDASRINYEVAAALAQMIESAGGRALITRERDGGASDVERLKLSESAGASRYLLISHRPTSKNGAPFIGHYPGSSTGAGLAGAIASSSALLKGGKLPAVIENANYALRQTSCAAVNLNLMPLSNRSRERLLSQPWNVAREAYAIYAGLLNHLDTEGALSGGKIELELALPNGKPARGAAATIDGYLSLMADDRGVVPVTALTPGAHQVEVNLQGYAPAIQEFTWPPHDDDIRVRITLSR